MGGVCGAHAERLARESFLPSLPHMPHHTTTTMTTTRGLLQRAG
jgi:hypothetical protein